MSNMSNVFKAFAKVDVDTQRRSTDVPFMGFKKPIKTNEISTKGLSETSKSHENIRNCKLICSPKIRFLDTAFLASKIDFFGDALDLL